MLDRLYARALTLAASPHAPLWLAAVSFAEASVFPLPPDVLLIPMVLSHRDRAWALAGLCTVASVCGGLLGWYIGAFLLQHVAMPIVHFYHAEDRLAAMQEQFRHWGVWIILVKGLTPIPFKIVTIASGAAHFPIVPFLLASLVTRGMRFFLVAGLLRAYGAPIQTFIEQRLTLVASAFGLVLVGGFVALKYL
ncbi:YqaA family protein [Nguyenibacter vanlangensis]|uniref:YqaA family protein n=1 Tax=Nguyenibacter vanlangensis TaxID=1216886 RepID=A0ABZ3DCK4_9PROT